MAKKATKAQFEKAANEMARSLMPEIKRCPQCGWAYHEEYGCDECGYDQESDDPNDGD